MSHPQQTDGSDIRPHNIMMCLHVIVISCAGMYMFGSNAAWVGAAVVAILMGCASACKSHCPSQWVAWAIITACHFAVIAGIVTVILFTNSVWWALAAAAVLLVLLTMQQHYGGCILTHVERAFSDDQVSVVDAAGMIFSARPYDPSDPQHPTLVAAGVMAASAFFAIVKIFVLACRSFMQDVTRLQSAPLELKQICNMILYSFSTQVSK